MIDFFTFAIYDQGDRLAMRGIPSLAVARTIASDVYRHDAEWDSFLEEQEPGKNIMFEFVDDALMFGHEAGRFFGSIAIERRCGCCGHVIARRSVSPQDV